MIDITVKSKQSNGAFRHQAKTTGAKKKFTYMKGWDAYEHCKWVRREIISRPLNKVTHGAKRDANTRPKNHHRHPSNLNISLRQGRTKSAAAPRHPPPLQPLKMPGNDFT